MEKQFIIAGSKSALLLSKDELHVLMSSASVSNMVIIDRNNLENASFAMCSDIVTKCAPNPLAFMLSMRMLKQCFDENDYMGIDTLLTTLVD